MRLVLGSVQLAVVNEESETEHDEHPGQVVVQFSARAVLTGSLGTVQEGSCFRVAL